MDLFALCAEERRSMADLAEKLRPDQLDSPSLIPTWSVRDVIAHLTVSLEISMARMLWTFVTSGGIEKAFDRLTWDMAKRPMPELVGILRGKADKRFSPPGAGPEAPLSDLLIHGLDIRRPLGIAREIPEERARVALRFLTETPARGFVDKGWRDGLRFEATNFAWSHGEGKPVRGHSDALMLAITGRVPALSDLEGEGVAVLRERFGAGSGPGRAA